MGILDWFRGLGSKRDDEAAEREELGGTDPGERELGLDQSLPSYAADSAAQVAADDVRDEEAPRPYGDNY
jgi:hypothetical protein